MFNTGELIDKNFECLPLKWDTDYFGVKSARINLNGVVDLNGQKLINKFYNNFNYTTIANIGNIKENNNWIGKQTNAFLTDINIRFIKYLNECKVNADDTTNIYNAYPRNEKIIAIAKNVFKYSRFFNDPMLPQKKALNIYSEWTKSAFYDGKKYFVITKRNNEVVGYILFSIDNNRDSAIIELIAVDEEYKGQKIGKCLVDALEPFLFKMGIKKIKVGTQLDNVTAVHFYVSVGFKYVGCSSIYHLWNF